MTAPYVTRYRNGEYLQYMKDVLELVNKQDVTTLLLTAQRDDLTTIVTSIDEAFQQSLGSALTQEIIDLDERRDKAFIGFKTLLNGFTYHADAAKQLHAEAAITTLNNYGNGVTRKSYQEETAIVNSLINDFETNIELVTALSALGITDWLTELKDANEAFAAKYLERVGETAANPLTNISELRTQATAAFRTLISHIEAHKVLGSDDAYALLESEIDVLTKQYNLVVDNRTATSDSEDDTDATDTVVSIDTEETV